MSNPLQSLLPKTPPRRSAATAFADAIGVILVADAILSALTGSSPIGHVFFHLPAIPAAALWPGLRQEAYYVARECAAYAKYYLTVR